MILFLIPSCSSFSTISTSETTENIANVTLIQKQSMLDNIYKSKSICKQIEIARFQILIFVWIGAIWQTQTEIECIDFIGQFRSFS